AASWSCRSRTARRRRRIRRPRWSSSDLSPRAPRRKTFPDCTTRCAPRLSPYHAEAEAAREMLADDQPDDHERNRDADRERRLAAVDAAFGRALIFRQFDRQRGDLSLGDDQSQQVLA